MQHSFDKMVFKKRNSQNRLVSLIIAYVGDFFEVYCKDYDVGEVHNAFVESAELFLAQQTLHV